jgi:hypothetical protein
MNFGLNITVILLCLDGYKFKDFDTQEMLYWGKTQAVSGSIEAMPGIFHGPQLSPAVPAVFLDIGGPSVGHGA